MKKEASTALVLFYALTVAFPAPAVSQGYESLLNGFLGRGKIDNHTQDLVQTNINTRQGQLEQEIAAGVASGQLNAAEESELRTQLTGVANMQGQYLAVGGGKLNNIQIQSLLNELSAVTTKLQAYLTNATTVSTTPNARRHDQWFRHNRENEGYSYNRAANGHIDSYQAEIGASIESALTSGKISAATAQSLRTQLNATDTTQALMTADGRLAQSESDQLMVKLDAIKNKLAQEIANGQRWRGRGNHYGWGHGDADTTAYGQSMLRQRIYDGLRSGKLSRSEADRLLRSEQQIASVEAQLQASGRLTHTEQRRLLADRERLNLQINQELTDHNAW
jgi:hypothetical protein